MAESAQIVRFNIRVYGILVNSAGQLLVSDEIIRGHPVTKFPGGGLEFGEGTRDCLKREFFEECGIEVKVGDHFYTTDFFLPSAFDRSQVISIYYLVSSHECDRILIADRPFQFAEPKRQEIFRWINFDHLQNEDQLRLAADVEVAQRLTAMYEQGN